jgi:hypothetical protein
MGLAKDGAELPTYRGYDWAVLLPWVGWKAAARTGKAWQAFGGVEVFDRDRYPLERPDCRTGRERHIRRLSGLAGLLRRPQSISVEALPVLFVSRDGGFDNLFSSQAPFSEFLGNLNEWAVD